MDLAVREARERAVLAHDQGLSLARAGIEGQRDCSIGEGERGRVLLAAHHLPTPTWTLRKRAPGTAWPTWPTCPGSPLPQFGVPSITKLRSSPTASHDRQNS